MAGRRFVTRAQWRGRAAGRVLSQAMPRGRPRMLPGQTHAVNPGVLSPILAEFFGSY